MSSQANETPQQGLVRQALALRDELKTNRRALAGLIAVLSLVSLYGLLLLDDAVAARRAAFRAEASLIQRAAAVAGDSDWTTRAKQSSEALAKLEARLWSFENEGVALANMQDWITTAGREAGLGKMQVRVELAKPKGVSADIRQLTATITAIQEEPSLTAFLDRIAREPHMLVVDQLHVEQRPAGTMQMTLVSYAKLAGTAGDAPK